MWQSTACSYYEVECINSLMDIGAWLCGWDIGAYPVPVSSQIFSYLVTGWSVRNR